MAATALSLLPDESELRSFAHAAAHLLVDRLPRWQGARAVSRRAGIGLQHLDHRDYLPGDEIRHIDWRQTARARRPIVRRFESESVSDWVLLVDASSSMAAHDAVKWAAAARVGAALAYALLQLGHRVGLLAFGSRVLAHCASGRGPHQYALIARTLSSLQPARVGEGSVLGNCAPLLGGGVTAFVLGDFLADDEMRRDLTALLPRCRELHAVQLCSAADLDLDLQGDVDLVDPETGARVPLQADATVQAHAARERAAMTGRLRAYCGRTGVAFSAWDITQPWQPALLAHLARARGTC